MSKLYSAHTLPRQDDQGKLIAQNPNVQTILFSCMQYCNGRVRVLLRGRIIGTFPNPAKAIHTGMITTTKP